MMPNRAHALSADIHIHSALSPCAENRMTPGEILGTLIRMGIDVFSITDHNSGFNCAAFSAAAEERGVLFIPGIELQSAEEIHLLGYFPDLQALEMFCAAVVKPGMMQGVRNDPLRFGNQLKIRSSGEIIGEEEDMLSMPLRQSIDMLVERIHDFNGVAVAAHIDRGFSVISHLGYIPPELRLDAVEVMDPGKNEEIRSMAMKGTDLNIISSSDAHYLDMIKAPKMRMRLKSMDIKGCLDCIKSGRIAILQKPLRRDGRPRDAERSKREWRELYR